MDELRLLLQIIIVKDWLRGAGGFSGRGGFLSQRSYTAVLSTSLSGLKPLFNIDLFPVAGGSELVKDGEEARPPVNCFKFEHGVPIKKETASSLLGRSCLQGGGAQTMKTMTVLRLWKRILEKIRDNVDRVLSNRLGLKPKSFCGFSVKAGLKLKKAGLKLKKARHSMLWSSLCCQIPTSCNVGE